MKQRVVTSLALAPVVLAACFFSTPYPLFLLCLVVATIAFWELRTLLGSTRVLPILSLLSMALPFYAIVSSTRYSPNILPWSCVFFLMGVLFAWMAARRAKATAAEVDLAGLWITMPFVAVWVVHNLFVIRTFEWQTPMLILLLPVWGGDIAALLVGRKFGTRPLAPKISPGKTVEGALAQLVASILIALALAPVASLSLPLAGACGLTAGVAGQAGDLFESYVKRRGGVKDSGSVLPGHGGVLDRIDSLLFATPFVALLVVFGPYLPLLGHPR